MLRTASVLLLLILGLLSFANRAPADTVNYTYDEAGRLTQARYSSGRTIAYTYDKAGNLLRRVVSTVQQGPTPVIPAAGVVNAASFLGGPVAAGEIVTLFGTDMGPGSLVGLRLARPGFLDTTLSDATVFFDGVASPLIYVSAGQTSAIVPYAVAGKTSTQMQVEYQGRRSAAVTLQVAPAAPALFSLNSSGSGGGAILNSDFSVNTPSNAAAKGSFVVLFGTGEGQTNPAGTDGKLAGDSLPKPVLSVSVSIDNKDAEVLYFGAAPELVAGVFQANVVIPANSGSGNVPVVVTVGGVQSQSGLTVAVR